MQFNSLKDTHTHTHIFVLNILVSEQCSVNILVNSAKETLVRAWLTTCPVDHSWEIFNPQPSGQTASLQFICIQLSKAPLETWSSKLALQRASATVCLGLLLLHCDGLASVNPSQCTLGHLQGSSQTCLEPGVGIP